MNPQQLLAHFDRLAEAPDAISRLRRFILDLAVRGKLVEQNPNDEPASELLPAVPESELNEQLFALPNGWSWVRVGAIADSRLGKMLDKAKNRGTPRRYLRNVNVRWFDFDLSDISEMPFDDSELDEFALRTGDVLICEGGEPGRAAVWDEREKNIYFQKAIHRVRFPKDVVPSFFVLTIRQSADSGRLCTYFTGAGIKHFTGIGLSTFLFPLPPLAEQHCIVAKVDELMGLCDRLEAAQGERERRRDRLAAASLHRLNQPAADATAFRAHACFHLGHLPRLTTCPDQIPALRQTILNLAVRGRLVAQDPKDVPASSILRDRQLLCDSAQCPFELPSGWAWSTFDKIGEVVGGGTPSKSEPSFWKGTIPWVSPKDMKVSKISDAQDHITEQAVESSSTRLLPTGALLMVVRGMILAHSFPSALTTVQVTINQDMKAIVPFHSDVATMLLLITRGLKPEILRLVQRSTHGTCKLLTEDLFNVPIPIPPVAEQRRIVAKVDELMAVCDRLEAELTTAQTASRRWLEAVLHEALAQPSCK